MKKLIALGCAALAIIITMFMVVGINNNGERTVVQWPNGTTFVKFTPGFYVQWFGTTWTYMDIITFDYDKAESEVGVSLDQGGITVRYRDGGTGTIFGKSRFSLPNDESTMLSLHKAFRSNDGVAYKLIKPVTEEGMNLTAGLMTSEDAYDTLRAVFTQWAEDQIKNGKFQTTLTETTEADIVTGKKTTKNIPVIKYGEDGLPIHLESDLKEYGISVTGFQIADWDFEPKTLDQIATKREATMGIITAKANAERAKQDAITAEELGKASVVKAQYEKEVEKVKAVVVAEQNKEVAVIAAKQAVDVAEQKKLEAEQLKLAANEYKQEQELRGQGDGAYKKAVMEADGALKQKLDTYERVMNKFASEFGKQKWVSEISFNSGGSASANGNSSNQVMDLISLLEVNVLKNLGLDMTIPSGGGTNRSVMKEINVSQK